MRKRLLAVVLGVVVLGGIAAGAQVVSAQRGGSSTVTGLTVTGEDLAYEVTRLNPDGTLSGRLKIRVNGQWRYISDSPSLVPAR